MFFGWLMHRPFLFIALSLLAVGLAVVGLDLIRYFDYYFRNHWTEATWVDEITTAKENEDKADLDSQNEVKKPARK